MRRFETISGNIDLQMPSDASVNVMANAFDGKITSDFPLMTKTTLFGPSSSASGTLGSDGRTLGDNILA